METEVIIDFLMELLPVNRRKKVIQLEILSGGGSWA